MIEIALNDISKSFVTNMVLKSVTFDVKTGEKVALIGRNGCGKTTVFKIISGKESYDGGTFSKRKDVRISFLDQIPDFEKDFSVDDVLKTAFSGLLEKKSRIEELERNLESLSERDLETYGSLQQQFEDGGGYLMDHSIEMICEGLKISDKMRSTDFNTISGGEKTTVMLAKMLLEKPDLLLLDEPTNHLDVASVEWLEKYLKNYSGAVLLISHDRFFLDRVAERIVEIEFGSTSSYKGNYSYYKEEKERRYLEEFKHYQDQQKKIKAMKAAIQKYKDWSIGGDLDHFVRKAKSLQNLLDRIEVLDKPDTDRKSISVAFDDSKRSGKDVLRVDGLSKSFGDRNLFSDLDLFITYRERIALVGRNGTGKSTLIKIIMNEIDPDRGTVKLGSNVKIAYLPQDIEFENEQLSILDTFLEIYPMDNIDARNRLARFLFSGDTVFREVKKLSGGEKVRLKLALLAEEQINLLILDEPTNHLDIDSREVLEELFTEFGGTILFISHDRYFLNRIATRVVEIEDRKLKSYGGNYDYYLEMKSREVVEESSGRPEEKVSAQELDHLRMKEKRRRKARIKKLEEEIERIQNQISEKEQELLNIGSDFEKAEAVIGTKTALENEMETLFEELLLISE